MRLDILRIKKLTFKDTFIYVKEIVSSNVLNFLKLLGMWVLFSFFLFCIARLLPDFLIAILSVFAYIVFYLFYLAFIAQARATIDAKRITPLSSLQEVYKGFMARKALDLLEIIPIALIILLVGFFPSSIFAVPIAFIITLAMFIYVSYTILAQPAMVIKKLSMLDSVKNATSLINGYFTFVFSLIMIFALCALIIYLPFVFIKTSLFVHQVLMAALIGVEVMLFAIMLTVVYTNLEIAWSTGFKTYEQGSVSDSLEDTNHDFTELFTKVPEVEIKEEIQTKEQKEEDLTDK